LLGANGAGKSTLLKAIAGVLPLRTGMRWTAQQLRLGYFAQHQVEQLRLDQSALWHLTRLEPATREQELRDFLGGFDFRGERALAPAAELSGGEKARLTLALLVREAPNLLLLDEPTNHLDIEMREALTEALQDYDGALVVGAHDRHLLRATADELWLVHDGGVTPFDGDLDDYRDWVLAQRRRESSARAVAAGGSDRARSTDADGMEARAPGAHPASAADGVPACAPGAPPARGADAAPTSNADRKAQKRAEALSRQLRAGARKPLLARQAELEAEMETLAAEKRTLDAWLASPDAYVAEARERMVEATERSGTLTWTLARLESEWLDVAEALEKLAQPQSVGPCQDRRT
jgi:ATP-binding cassette subfamily F protein 3